MKCHDYSKYYDVTMSWQRRVDLHTCSQYEQAAGSVRAEVELEVGLTTRLLHRYVQVGVAVE